MNKQIHKQSNTVKPMLIDSLQVYLGGSFDPVHNAHLQLASSVYEQLLPIAHSNNLSLNIHLLPTAGSPFKENYTPAKHRLAMLQLATKNTNIQIDETELWQTPPVYTFDTLQRLQQQHPKSSIIFIMGADSAVSIEKWHKGLELINHAHLWIFPRNAITHNNDDEQLPQRSWQITAPILTKHFIHDLQSLAIKRTGCIYFDTNKVSQISSTKIRAVLQGFTHNYKDIDTLLPHSVLRYAHQHSLYKN